MIINDLTVEDLFAKFWAEESLTELDRAIFDHALDAWPMGRLAQHHATTSNALHRRKQELFALFRGYLERRGITCSADVFA